MKPSLTSFATLGLVLATALAAPAARSTQYHDASAGTSCHPAAGNSGLFTRSNNYITNAGTVSQYVACSFVMSDASSTVQNTAYLAVHTESTQAGTRTVACGAQTGAYYGGANQVHAGSVMSHTFIAPGNISLIWTASTLPRSQPYHVMTMTCKLDPGTRMGLIEYVG